MKEKPEGDFCGSFAGRIDGRTAGIAPPGDAWEGRSSASRWRSREDAKPLWEPPRSLLNNATPRSHAPDHGADGSPVLISGNNSLIAWG